MRNASLVARAHTAERISDLRRKAIAFAIANGEPIVSIARKHRTSEHIVAIISDEDWQSVADHKQRLAAQAERNALMAGEQIAEALEARKYPIGQLPVVYGVSLDKSVSLRGDPFQSQAQQHLHLHLQSTNISAQFNDLLNTLQTAPGAPSLPSRTLPSHDVSNPATLTLPASSIVEPMPTEHSPDTVKLSSNAKRKKA